ncbi:MAG: MATE family efflux transporter [Pyramidobacter sp.]|nr:MATE family efflux transporter [Pyramidobacter sp.]
MIQRAHSRDMIEGVIWKEILKFFFPIMLGTVFQQLYNTVDAIGGGRFAVKGSQAAVGGPTSYLVYLLVNFFVGITSGATVVIAQFYGMEDAERTKKAVHTSMALSLYAGAVMSVVGVLIAAPALRAMNTPAEVLPHAASYLRIFYGGLLFSFVYNMGSSVLRAKGDSKRPFYMLVAATFTNIAADIVLVIYCGMGVAGAAWATILSQAVSAAGVAWFLLREEGEFRLDPRRLWKFDWLILQNIGRIGVPSGIQSAVFSVSNIVIQSAINGFGVDTVAAFATYGKIDHLFWMVLTALGVSVSTVVGQNFGARRYDRVMRAVYVTMGYALIAALFFGFGQALFVEPLYRIFTIDTEVIRIGSQVTWIMSPLYFLYIPVMALAGGMRGTGDAIVPTAATAAGICGLRLVWVWCVLPFFRTFQALTWGYPVSWALTSAFFLIYHWKGNWLERSIQRAGHARNNE